MCLLWYVCKKKSYLSKSKDFTQSLCSGTTSKLQDLSLQSERSDTITLPTVFNYHKIQPTNALQAGSTTELLDLSIQTGNSCFLSINIELYNSLKVGCCSPLQLIS